MGRPRREALGMREKRGGEDVGSALEGAGGEAVVDVVRRAEAERAVIGARCCTSRRRAAVAARVLDAVKRSGKPGRYLSVLKADSEKGLSLETCGREWVLVTPRSASSNATDLLVIELPRSACSVSCSAFDALATARLLDQLARQRRTLLVRHHPADHVAAENVEDHVQVEVRPLRGARAAS